VSLDNFILQAVLGQVSLDQIIFGKGN